jgi:hypothetical protein
LEPAALDVAREEVDVTTGRFNIILGLLVLVAAGVAGLALGQTLEPYYANGYGQITLWRYLTKAGHTHGMPFGIINIVFGILIGRAACSEALKRAGAILTALALALPVGVALRGLTAGAAYARPIAMIGGMALMAACFVMIPVARSQTGK